MPGGMNLEVWFPQQNEVSVFLESSYPDPDEEQFFETCLFALFAARQITNLRSEGTSLAFVLQTIDVSNPLIQTRGRLDTVRVSSPRNSGGGGGRKGFTAELRPGKRPFFKLHGHGFGMLGRGAGYYAPTSTLALLWWLLEQRRDDPLYQRALAATSENVGILGIQGRIGVATQADAGMEAASAAWEETRQEIVATTEYELTDEAREACAEHGIDFSMLVAIAARHLHETFAQREPDGYTMAVRGRDAQHACRIETLLAAGRGEELERAFAAVRAAEASGNPATIAAANAHYQRTLSELCDTYGLESVVEALRRELFKDGGRT